jgi:osmotically-inducible protein OsmY
MGHHDQEFEEYEQMDPRDTETERRSMTTSGGSTRQTQGGSGGGWTGYVMPYRYYGPGYRGVGYYSVMYQGSDEPEAGRGTSSGRTFDQSRVRYGQGQGAGAAWSGGGERGRYYGQGPRGYQRSDERIREDVSDRLMENGELDASDIDIQVSNGEVTLSGSVDSRWAKRLAEDLAEACMGVRDVMNQLKVRSEGAPSGMSGTGRSPAVSTRQATRSSQTASRQTSPASSTANGARKKESSTSR